MRARLPRKPQLADIQRAMAGAIMRPLTPGEGMQRDSSAIAAGIIKPNDRLDSFERLQIYNQQYWWRLLANFSDDFHGLRAVLGQRRFDRLATAYLEHCPSTSWSLRDLGSGLEQFVIAHPELVKPHERLALDMVRVEWARVVAFDGPEHPRLDPARVLKRPPARLRIGVQPYVTLLELWHPIDELLGKLRNAPIETESVSNAVAATRSRRRKRLFARARKSPVYLAVHRHDLSVYYKRLDPEAYCLLVALRAGETLEAACAQAFDETQERPGKSAAKVQMWFANWMRLGWLCTPGVP
jgi:Putative DNA-binding domain